MQAGGPHHNQKMQAGGSHHKEDVRCLKPKGVPVTRRIMFFATRDDLLTILNPIERRVPLTYRLRVSGTSDVTAWDSAAAISNLVPVRVGGQNDQPSYLVMPTASPYKPFEREMPDGRTLRGVYPEGNPDSVVMYPGGLFGSEFVIAGEFASGLPKPPGFDLMGALQRAVPAEFMRIQDCYVGSLARTLAAGGTRLVGSTRQPPSSDLRLTAATEQIDDSDVTPDGTGR